jgi:DNA-binding XRE family transcriptional regulator
LIITKLFNKNFRVFCYVLAAKQNKLKHFYADFGSVIKKYRLEAGLTLEQLGFEIGIGKADMHLIEKGKNITLLTLVKISLVLEKKLNQFFIFEHSLTITDLDTLVSSKKSSKKKK